MFFSTEICVDKSHPLHEMWLLSCYLEDNRARKKRIPDRSLKRAELVKILKELTKMFQVDGRRRGFALAMNTDMFNAVVYTLEFKAINLLSESRKLLVKINKKNPFRAFEDQCEDLLNINLDTHVAAAKTTTVLQSFPDSDALKRRFNECTMLDFDVEKPTNAQNNHEGDFGNMTFDDIEAIERNSQQGEDRREPNVLGEFEDPSFLPGIMEAELRDANISPLQQVNDIGDFLGLPPQDLAAQDQDTDMLFQSYQVVNDTTGAATLGNDDGLGDDMTATRRDDEASVTGRDEDALGVSRPLPNIVIERPSDEGQDAANGVVLTPPPQMDVDDEYGPAFNRAVNPDTYDQVAPMVDEMEEQRDVAAVDEPPAPGVEINVIPETQDDDDIELPAAAPANIPAPKKKNRRKKRKLIVDEVISISRSEFQAQLVFLDSEETVRSKAKKAQPQRSADELFRNPMTQFDSQSELSELWKFTHRSLITKRPREPSSSSSSEDEESRDRRDIELSSLRDGLQVDLSSIPDVSGVLRDVGASQSNLEDLPGFLQDQDIPQDMDLGASEMRDATEVTAGQADIESTGLPPDRRERSKDANFNSSVSELRGTSDITGINAALPPQPPAEHIQVSEEPSALLQVNQEPTALDITPKDDQMMPQVEPVLDNEVPLEEEPQAEAAVDPYANVGLMALNIAAPATSAGELLDKMRDVADGNNSLFFSSVCPSESTDKLLAGVTFFNMLKLQRSAYIECQQDELKDDIDIRLEHKDGSEYGSSSEYATAGSSSA